jgi:hypothetical protein
VSFPLRYKAAWQGYWYSTFRDNAIISSSRVETTTTAPPLKLLPQFQTPVPTAPPLPRTYRRFIVLHIHSHIPKHKPWNNCVQLIQSHTPTATRSAHPLLPKYGRSYPTKQYKQVLNTRILVIVHALQCSSLGSAAYFISDAIILVQVELPPLQSSLTAQEARTLTATNRTRTLNSSELRFALHFGLFTPLYNQSLCVPFAMPLGYNLYDHQNCDSLPKKYVPFKKLVVTICTKWCNTNKLYILPTTVFIRLVWLPQ